MMCVYLAEEGGTVKHEGKHLLMYSRSHLSRSRILCCKRNEPMQMVYSVPQDLDLRGIPWILLRSNGQQHVAQGGRGWKLGGTDVDRLCCNFCSFVAKESQLTLSFLWICRARGPKGRRAAGEAPMEAGFRVNYGSGI
jgi:hypothetical protein